MNQKIRKVVSVFFVAFVTSCTVFASPVPQTDLSGFSPIKHFEQQQRSTISQAKDYAIPGGKGTLTSNVWRSTNPIPSGNTYQWEYQVSAVYTGSMTVEKIRTTWQGQASLRNSASISLGVGMDSVQAGAGSSWQSTNTVVKYFENTLGQKISDYRSNMVVSPAVDYRSGTISLTNTASVKLKGDAKTYSYSASV